MSETAMIPPAKPAPTLRTMVTHRFGAPTLPKRQPLGWKPALDHIVVGSGQGVGVLARLLASPPEGRIEGVIFASDAVDLPETIARTEDPARFAARLAECLENAPMGAELYAAGPEAFLTEVQRIATAAGFPPDAVMTERAGSAARDCQCAHCKTVIRGLAHRFCICPACGLSLLVRDHFSPRLGLYQAVAISPTDPRIAIYRETVLE